MPTPFLERRTAASRFVVLGLLPRGCRALVDATFEEVAAEAGAEGDYMQVKWVHGPPRGSLTSWAWQPSGGWDGSSNCQLPSVVERMTCCPDGWPWEGSLPTYQVCRASTGTGHWQCAPGWSQLSSAPYCAKDSEDACSQVEGNPNYQPCGALPANNLERVLGFHTGHYRLDWDVDTMLPVSFEYGGVPVALPNGLSPFVKVAESSTGTPVSCSGPADADLNAAGYPVRLVRAGRYHAHYWIGGLQCGSASATLEIKAWTDCLQLNLTSDAETPVKLELSLGSFSAATTDGQTAATLGFCLRADGGGPEEMPALSTPADAGLGLAVYEGAGCPTSIYVTRVIHWAWQGLTMYFCTDPATLPSGCPGTGWTLLTDEAPDGVVLVATGSAVSRSSSHGQGASNNRCSGVAGTDAFSVPIQQTTDTPSSYNSGFTMTFDPADLPVVGEAGSWFVSLSPNSAKGLLNNDAYAMELTNPTAASVLFRMHFHIQQPRGVTGIATWLRNLTDKSPSGFHVQISKNWHTTEAPHYSYWFSALVALRLPPLSRMQAEIVLAYQYFGGLHSVSHAQLCLIGWGGGNGLWEEVGLGSSGETITYEPNKQQRRADALDTRPFLVCGMDSPEGQCLGTPDATRWTENIGGSEFLGAFTASGSYQYLVGVATHHTANGPRLTNATNVGLTADGAVRATQRASTWTVDDFPRHLHAFRYEVLMNVSYPRLILYQLGADNYNYAAQPGLARGDGSGLTEAIAALPTDLALNDRSQYAWPACTGPAPCWFALTSRGQETAHRGLVVRRWESRLGGQAMPAGQGYTARVVGTRNSGAGLEFGLPDDVPALQVGDFIEGELELFLYPRAAEVYYGTSSSLQTWLAEAASAGNNWTVAHYEALAGNLEVDVQEGALERTFPLRVRMAPGGASFCVSLSDRWPGVLPVSISGLPSSHAGQLLLYDGSTWADANSTPGDFQVDDESNRPNDLSYVITYSLRLSDLPSVSDSQCFRFALSESSTTTTSSTIVTTSSTVVTTTTTTTTTNTETFIMHFATLMELQDSSVLQDFLQIVPEPPDPLTLLGRCVTTTLKP